MKKTLLLFLLTLIGFIAFSQSPNAFNYQAIVRDGLGGGEYIPNTVVTFRFKIIRGTINGPVSYSELKNAVTNAFGLASLSVGSGTPITGRFDTITWGSTNYFLGVDISLDSGQTFIVLGATQLLSVPYAKYADSTGPTNQSVINYYGRGYVFVNATDTAYQTIVGLDTTINIPANFTTLFSATGSAYGTGFDCLSSLRATLFIDGIAPIMGGTQVLNIVTDNNISSGGANWTINYPAQLSAGPHTVTVKVKSNSLQNECSVTVDNGGFFDHSVLTVTNLKN